jgi:hypothetical protein
MINHIHYFIPTQYDDIPATVCAPRPVAWTSRNRPPVPVSAPINSI